MILGGSDSDGAAAELLTPYVADNYYTLMSILYSSSPSISSVLTAVKRWSTLKSSCVDQDPPDVPHSEEKSSGYPLIPAGIRRYTEIVPKREKKFPLGRNTRRA